jgi:hypothetical protein
MSNDQGLHDDGCPNLKLHGLLSQPVNHQQVLAAGAAVVMPSADKPSCCTLQCLATCLSRLLGKPVMS